MAGPKDHYLKEPKRSLGRKKHRVREKPANSPGEFGAAVRAAQKQLDATTERPAPGQQVALAVNEIETRTELFQPRGFYMGVYELDNSFVSKLKREIGIRGELDPVLVIKLGTAWVVVDGHHRLDAYKRFGWKEPLTCDWFGGNVHEAVDESVRRNSVLKLQMDQPDRLEQAWKRTVLHWGSKADVRKLCGVSDGLVAMMRRVEARYREDSDAGRLFRERLAGVGIDEVSWSAARAAFLDLEQKEVDQHEAAAKLAKRMRSSLQDRLSLNHEITALALELYDFALVEFLKDRPPSRPPEAGTAEDEEVDPDSPF
jgi:hypothetical protein